MLVCGGIVDFETLCCGPLVVVDFVSRFVCALRVVVLVAGRGNDDFVGIVCHSSGPSMVVCYRDFILSRLVGPSVW